MNVSAIDTKSNIYDEIPVSANDVYALHKLPTTSHEPAITTNLSEAYICPTAPNVVYACPTAPNVAYACLSPTAPIETCVCPTASDEAHGAMTDQQRSCADSEEDQDMYDCVRNE